MTISRSPKPHASTMSNGSFTVRTAMPVSEPAIPATTMPTPSPPRAVFPTPTMTASLRTIHLDVEEVCRAGDAGIVVPDRLLQQVLKVGIAQLEVPFDQMKEIRLDRSLVLCRRRDDLGGLDPSFGIDLVTVVQQPARCLTCAVPDAGSRGDRHVRMSRALIPVEDVQGQVDGVKSLDRTHHDRLERVRARRREPVAMRSLQSNRPE